MWIGVFEGEIKEMLSQVNEGRFTWYNEGPTHVFTADVYLKGLINTVSEQKPLSAVIHIPCNQPPHMRAGRISRITFYSLQIFFFFLFFFFIGVDAEFELFLSLTLTFQLSFIYTLLNKQV